jgi:Ca2+-binding RTX toxin-like protein
MTANLATGKATGSGTDTLVNIERLYGSENADRFTGDSRANVLYTYGGDDSLDGGAGADTMIGGLGNDLYYVDAAGDVVVEAANEGIDSVYSYLGAYTLAANVENGRILSGSWANLTGNALDNFLYAGTGNNAINGGDGIDTVSFYYGVTGTSGVTASLLTGKATGSGSDTLTNVERLYGTENADSFTGDAKANTLYTYGGNDILDGGLGNDVLTGGAGADAFVFSTALNGTANVDRITDFVAGTDTIRLENAVFTKLANTGTLGANNFKVIGSAPLDADDFILYDKASGYLYYDADGSGAGAAVKFALVGVNLSLTYADFTVM